MEFIPLAPIANRWKTEPNLTDYEKIRADFSWDAALEALDGLPNDGGLNIAYEAVDRHANNPTLRHYTAFRWIGKDDGIIDLTYGDLQTQTNRFANVLQTLGVGREDRVFVLSNRIPPVYIAALGTLKNGSVFCPLFSAFGPEPITQRINRGDGKVLVITEKLYQQKIAPQRDKLPKLQTILLMDVAEGVRDDVLSLPYLMLKASPNFTIPPTDPEQMAILHFTSGTTGMPKGAIHVHKAVVTHYITGKYALDLHPDDIFWCTADPGWVTGTSYGIIAPLLHSVTSIIDEAEFDADRWYRILDEQRVTVWYTAPTAIRRLMRPDNQPRELLGEVPALNGYWRDDEHQPQAAIHIGFAIALRQGELIAPAIHHADLKSLDELMAALRDLIMRTRNGRLRGSEMTDATITLTNLGDLGVEKVFGVIYPPQVALVGFGKISDQVWGENGMIGVRPVLTTTLAADHRATDGRIGGKFLNLLKKYLEEPAWME